MRTSARKMHEENYDLQDDNSNDDWSMHYIILLKETADEHDYTMTIHNNCMDYNYNIQKIRKRMDIKCSREYNKKNTIVLVSRVQSQ